MSVVTTLAIFCNDHDQVHAIVEINDWLATRQRPQMPLARLNNAFAGTKHPEWNSFGAAYNHLDIQDFIEFVLSRVWFENDRTILVIKPQDEPGCAYKPCGPEWWWDGATNAYRLPLQLPVLTSK